MDYPWHHKELYMTEQLSLSLFTLFSINQHSSSLTAWITILNATRANQVEQLFLRQVHCSQLWREQGDTETKTHPGCVCHRSITLWSQFWLQFFINSVILHKSLILSQSLFLSCINRNTDYQINTDYYGEQMILSKGMLLAKHQHPSWHPTNSGPLPNSQAVYGQNPLEITTGRQGHAGVQHTLSV